MKFREALQYAHNQLVLHPDRYRFSNADIPDARGQSACLLGLACEGAGLSGRSDGVFTFGKHFFACKGRTYIDGSYLIQEEHFYRDLDDIAKQSQTLDKAYQWRYDVAAAEAILGLYLQSGNPDLDRDMPSNDDLDLISERDPEDDDEEDDEDWDDEDNDDDAESDEEDDDEDDDSDSDVRDEAPGPDKA